MPKEIYRNNFSINNVAPQVYFEMAQSVWNLQTATVKKRYLTKQIYVFDNVDNLGSYFLVNELRALIKATLNEIVSNPNHIDKIHQQTIKYNQMYFEAAESIRKINFAKLENKKLLALYKKLYYWQYKSHGWSLATTWFVDSDGEDFSNYLLSVIKEKIERKSLDMDTSGAFSVLTTPVKKSLSKAEEEESLKVVDWINKDSNLKQWFVGRVTAELVADFKNLPAAAKRKMFNHYYKWRWIPYGYRGPAYNLDYYLEVWRGLLHQDIDVKKQLSESQKTASNVQKKRRQLIAKLDLSPHEKHLFDIAAEIVWIKGYRKDCFYHGFFVNDMILAEVAKRSGLSLLQAQFLAPEEISLALRHKDLSEELNKRVKFCVLYNVKKRLCFLTGQKARDFLKKHKFEKIKIKITNELKGACACPGAAKGVVKFINTPDDMRKMNVGDIMAAHTTFPALVPAMKKAAAIITEDGGITCLAAIVSRELQTPCVVGCKNALSILKEGDMVEVDAERGVVRKI